MQLMQASGQAGACRQRAFASRAPVAVARPRASRRAATVVLAAAFAPPTVSDTKRKFLEAYTKPVPAMYSVVLQELLVQQHFIRYSIAYQYNEVFALGFVSVYDQIMEGMPAEERAKIFKAYLASLGEDAGKFRADAERMEQQAAASGDSLTPSDSGNDVQKCLARVAGLAEGGKFGYNRFFAIGLFRLLELTGAKEPAALERLVKAVGVRAESVNKDLMTYKSVLSKLSVAKELMREFLEREKRKQAEREAAKAAAPAPAASA